VSKLKQTEISPPGEGVPWIGIGLSRHTSQEMLMCYLRNCEGASGRFTDAGSNTVATAIPEVRTRFRNTEFVPTVVPVEKQSTDRGGRQEKYDPKMCAQLARDSVHLLRRWSILSETMVLERPNREQVCGSYTRHQEMGLTTIVLFACQALCKQLSICECHEDVTKFQAVEKPSKENS
jgi:hypothetical protein